MGNRSRFAIATAIVSISLTAVSEASAATEVGSNCEANSFEKDITLVQLANAEEEVLPTAVPAAGVVTRWKVNSGLPSTISERLKVLRPTGTPGQFQVIAESADAPVAQGLNAFDVQIPVQAGDRFGVYGAAPSGAIYCPTFSSQDMYGYFFGNPLTGSTPIFLTDKKVRVAVSAVIEPDADRDGYGDETQDSCPQSAAFQSTCPAVSLDLRPRAGRKAATLRVTASSSAPVTVTGAVKLPKGKSRTSKAAAWVKLFGGTQVVESGEIARFELAFSKRLRKALKSLPPKRSLKLWITATATDLTGRVTTPVVSVKLRGQVR